MYIFWHFYVAQNTNNDLGAFVGLYTFIEEVTPCDSIYIAFFYNMHKTYCLIQ